MKQYEAGGNLPKFETVKNVLVLGSGAIKIGEAGESQSDR
jgi:hypothetical protein